MIQKGLVLVLAGAFRCGGMGWVAMSTFSPVGSRSSNGMRMCVCVCVCMCVCVCVWTEWTWSMHYFGISTDQFILCYASVIHTSTHTRTHPQTIWGQRTDGAKSGYCWVGRDLGCDTYTPTQAHARTHTHIVTHTHTNISAYNDSDTVMFFSFFFFSLFDFR